MFTREDYAIYLFLALLAIGATAIELMDRKAERQAVSCLRLNKECPPCR